VVDSNGTKAAVKRWLQKLLKSDKRWLEVVIPGLLLLLAVYVHVQQPAPLTHLQNLVWDNYQRAKPRIYEPVPVRIVDIDEESLARLGQWPWPRTGVARLVDRLAELSAATIAFDILFSEPDRISPANLLRHWQGRPEAGNLARVLAQMPDSDAILAESMKRVPTVTAFALLSDNSFKSTPAVNYGVAAAGDDPLLFVRNLQGAVTTLPILQDAAVGNGTVNYVPDSDNVIRRAPLLFGYNGQVFPTLALEALRVAQGASTYVVKSSGASGEISFGKQTGIVEVKVGQFVVPTDSVGALLLHDTGQVKDRFIPAWQVLEPDFDANRVAGNIVIIGSSAQGLRDVKTTPLSPALPGVELHAMVIEQILAGDFLFRPDLAIGAERIYLVIFGGILIFALRRVGAIWSAILGLSAVVIAWAASWYGFSHFGHLIDPLFPSLVAVLIYVSSSLISFLRTESEKRFIRMAFSRYLSPNVVEELTRHPDRLQLGGQMRELTILFSDIRGFTKISESLNPQALTRLINNYLTPMTWVIQNEKGCVDKYIGDCIVAFWNAPMDDPSHVPNAVRTALQMRRKLQELNVAWRSEAEVEGRNFIEISTGLGLNTGDCCVGNLGSEQRFDYSVLGDAVNTASRLEGLTKGYGIDLIIGESTAAKAGDFALVEIDQVRVKGRATPLHIYTVMGDEAHARTPEFVVLHEKQAEMLAAYRRQDWDTASAMLAECRTLAPSLHGLHDVFAARIEEYRAAPPPADWDGVYEARTKEG
jgi:adenylate cyclase